MKKKQKKKRKSSPEAANMEALLKALDKMPREEAARLTAPLVGWLLKGIQQIQNQHPETHRQAEEMMERLRLWITQLRDGGTAPQDLAKMYGMSEDELRAFLAMKDERH